MYTHQYLSDHSHPHTDHRPAIHKPHDDDDNDKEEEDAAESEENDKQDGLQPFVDGLVTLSLLPKSRWYNLHNLDIIKVWVEISSA